MAKENILENLQMFIQQSLASKGSVKRLIMLSRIINIVK